MGNAMGDICNTNETRNPPKSASGMPQLTAAPGNLKHVPPSTPIAGVSRDSHVVMKEVILPSASETHELVYEPLSRCIFVSQMSNSVLLRIPVGEDGMMMEEKLEGWIIGQVDPENAKKGIEGLHNISLSYVHPGCLWLSLQFSNTILLMDAATLEVKQILHVPTEMPSSSPDCPVSWIGGPHCVRECPKTGEIWVALKGPIACHPAVDHEDVPQDKLLNPDGSINEAVYAKCMESIQAGEDPFGDIKNLRVLCSEIRDCCSSDNLVASMKSLKQLGFNTPVPKAFAIWHLHPENYDIDDPEKGGTVYPCKPSPPMVTIDEHCRCWVAQDQQEEVMIIDPKKRGFGHKGTVNGQLVEFDLSGNGDTTLQYIVPRPLQCKKIVGPAITTAPDGAIWASLLGGQSALVRINPHCLSRTLYRIGLPDWCKDCNIIHMVFAPKDRSAGVGAPMPNALPNRPRYTGNRAEWQENNTEPPAGKTLLETTEPGVLMEDAPFHTAFCLSSDLVNASSFNGIIVLLFDNSWRTIVARRVVPLPTQGCASHRLELVDVDGSPGSRSLVVTELSAAKLFQIKTERLLSYVTRMDEKIEMQQVDHPQCPADGLEVRTYTAHQIGHNT